MMCRQEANGKKRRREVNRGRGRGVQPNDNIVGDYQRFVTTIFDRTIQCIVTKSDQVIDSVIRSLMGNGIRRQRLVVGLGVETTHQQDIATIQLCYHHYCLIYHMFGQPSFPPSLKKFLFNPDITFVGFYLKWELEILKRQAGFEVDVPCLDLAIFAPALFSVDNNLSLLSTVVLEYVDEDMLKRDIRWDLEDLSCQQVGCASFVAFFSLQIGTLLLRAEAGNPPRNCICRWNEVELMIGLIHKVQIFDRTIVTYVTKRLIAAEKWIADVARYRHLYRCVGFDVELITVNNRPRIGTVQFCVRSRCLIIQFNQMKDPYLPNLEKFLLESHNTFVGVDIKRKMKMLIDSLRFANGGRLKCVDLGMYATVMHRRPELNKAGHEELARVLLETRVEMPTNVDADWGRPWLSVAQMKHACIRAAVAYELGSRMLPPRE